LGKIFDALEKSKQRLQTSRSPTETSVMNIRRHSVTKRTAGDSKALRGHANVSDRVPPEKIKGDRTEKQIAVVYENSGLIDDRRVDKNLVTLLKPHSYEAEQFKILRTSLLFPSCGQPARSIMVTSALPGEGKSFVAANLAISISQNINEHVLLIDCDLRKSAVQRYFGFSDVPGMSDYLAHGKPLSTLLLKSGVNKLTLLPGGKTPHNPSELLSSNKMSELLVEVKERYSDRYVIIDSPPPKLTAETNALAKQVDGILIVVKYGSTDREAVRDLIQGFDKEKILGVVVNWFDIRSLNGYHYGTYKKYSDYYCKP
jgi:protein-tyrosine kinase